jgi:hypothetical protein
MLVRSPHKQREFETGLGEGFSQRNAYFHRVSESAMASTPAGKFAVKTTKK